MSLHLGKASIHQLCTCKTANHLNESSERVAVLITLDGLLLRSVTYKLIYFFFSINKVFKKAGLTMVVK